MRKSLFLCLLFGLSSFACGNSSAPQEPSTDGGGADGGNNGGGACVDTKRSEPSIVCDSLDNGTTCGDRGTCQDGDCLFPEANTPCDFDFTSAPEGAYLVIECDHDLGGAEIILADGITLEYNGGSIRNGKLRLRGGTISGELLNPELELGLRELGGSLVDPTFVFDSERWQMQVGPATDQIALSNRQHLKMAIDQVGDLGGTTFILGNMDIFLDVATGSYSERTILLPSNFHLQMCNDTHLRVYPNTAWEYSLIATRETTNVHISGGHLWGDRFTHDYEGGGSSVQDQGLGIYILGSVDVLIENISANQFIGDGLVVGVASRRNDDGSPKEGRQYAANITIRNSLFDENRRNGLALTDVTGALLEGLTISNTALGDADVDGRSAGRSPRQGIDIEPFQPAVGDGSDTLRILEEVTDVVIRNSTFSGNYAGDIDFFKCHRVEAYGNTFGSGVASVAAYEVSVHDNTFIADSVDRPRAINVKAVIRDSGFHFVRDWKIYDNSITGYENGINIGGENQSVYGNTISDFTTGIFLLTGINNTFENNTMTSTRENSKGYGNFRGISLTGEISGGSVNVAGFPLRLNQVNQDLVGSGSLLIEDIEFTSTSGAQVEVIDSSHITVQNCIADGFGETNSGEGVVFTGNTVR